jgi:hypothetical protein
MRFFGHRSSFGSRIVSKFAASWLGRSMAVTVLGRGPIFWPRRRGLYQPNMSTDAIHVRHDFGFSVTCPGKRSARPFVSSDFLADIARPGSRTGFRALAMEIDEACGSSVSGEGLEPLGRGRSTESPAPAADP